mmetsp:Transcript_16870/g.14788  ORF Transcript_16870/g.14788 Transcript_16870/m.14788 type:complete len:214 (+) Transcript_16870:220-861(+)
MNSPSMTKIVKKIKLQRSNTKLCTNNSIFAMTLCNPIEISKLKPRKALRKIIRKMNDLISTKTRPQTANKKINKPKVKLRRAQSADTQYSKVYPRVSYTTQKHKIFDAKIRATTALDKWKRMKKSSDLELLKITKEDPDFVNFLTWDKDLYKLLGKSTAFDNYDKSLTRVRSKDDPTQKYTTKWLKKLDNKINKVEIKYGDEVKNSVITDNRC